MIDESGVACPHCGMRYTWPTLYAGEHVKPQLDVQHTTRCHLCGTSWSYIMVEPKGVVSKLRRKKVELSMLLIRELYHFEWEQPEQQAAEEAALKTYFIVTEG